MPSTSTCGSCESRKAYRSTAPFKRIYVARFNFHGADQQKKVGKLEDFAGCAVIISHDRRFLDRIATHILAFEGDSQVVWFEGNYSAYEADPAPALAPTPTSPTASSAGI